ncbi:hypothetical protein BGZ65_006084 [Modicella reniformis]|uniref:Uncharacterized protein n=1 Tax=Modicella reniformis TaxID=1440133 RepID=A0A9P6JLC5_9FUNG|nr:hypothetical protein BGZ65_006084 [Modicella reniformis]
MNDIHKDIKSDREKLMATMLASFMEARILEQQQQQQQRKEQKHLACGEDHEHNRLWRITDQEADAQRIDNVLKPFGLRIAEGVELRTPMLRPYLWKSGPNANWNSINEEEEEVEDEEEEEEEEEEGSSGENMTLQETNITRQRRMTVDYSKYFGSLVSYEWRFLKFERLIRLRRLPLSMRGDVFYDPLVTFQGALSLEPSEMDENEDDEEQSEIHSRNQTTDGEYKSSLMESLARLLLHYNFEIITHLAMDMSDAQKFLPYAPKLAKLKTIHLQRSISMPDSYLENTLQFIRQNRTAFPAKYPLDLELDYGWFSYDSESDGLLLVPMDSGEGSVEKLAVAFVNRQRDSLYQFMKPLFALLEATGPPKNLRVTQIPFFYGHSDGIRLDRLESFSDNDPFRLDYGEGPALRNFLKKCDHVRELDICVGNKDFFTWAADETLAVAGYPTSILSGLRSESVAGQDPPTLRFDFESLRTMQNLESLEMSVSKKIVMWYMTSEFMARQESAWELKYNLPPSGTNVDVGEDKNVNKGGELWDWSLPTLKSLTLNGPPATMFFLEWLRGCPNLEELSLMATGEYQHITRNPFFAPHWFSPREVFMTEIGVDDENRNESINNHKGASDDGPLLQSRLKKIVLSGSWVMSNDILISLLTVYAPLLERFHVDRLHERNSLNGTQFLRVMRQVDKINRTYAKRILSEQNDAEQQEQKMPGENLTLVSAKYTLSKRERPALKVVVIKQSDVACYHANNLRVYCLISQYLVRQEDYDLMEDIMFGRVVTDTPTS